MAQFRYRLGPAAPVNWNGWPAWVTLMGCPVAADRTVAAFKVTVPPVAACKPCKSTICCWSPVGSTTAVTDEALTEPDTLCGGAAWRVIDPPSPGVGDPSLDKDSGVIIPDIPT